MISDFIESAKKQFEYYKLLAEKTIDQLPEKALFWQYNTESNSIATIMKHMSGNMLSRWTDFLTTDGEKEWRNRDSEFENDINSKAELLIIWGKGWECLFNALNSLKYSDLNRIIYIRKLGQTVLDAINRQLAHYPYHIGQIVFIGKMALDNHWVSLTIARGLSNDYNEKKFTQAQKIEYFGKEFFDNNDSTKNNTSLL
jgi:hypothetical protein